MSSLGHNELEPKWLISLYPPASWGYILIFLLNKNISALDGTQCKCSGTCKDHSLWVSMTYKEMNKFESLHGFHSLVFIGELLENSAESDRLNNITVTLHTIFSDGFCCKKVLYLYLNIMEVCSLVIEFLAIRQQAVIWIIDDQDLGPHEMLLCIPQWVSVSAKMMYIECVEEHQEKKNTYCIKLNNKTWQLLHVIIVIMLFKVAWDPIKTTYYCHGALRKCR